VRHSLIVSALAASWGIIGIVVAKLDELPALTIVFFRVALAALAIGAFLAATRRVFLMRLPSRAPLGLGFLLALHWGLYFLALQNTSVTSAVLITYSGPIFMAMLAPVMLSEHVPRSTIVALALSLGGVGLIALAGGDGAGAVRVEGVLLALGAAVSMAVLIVSLKRWGHHLEPITVVFWQSVTAAVLLTPAVVLPSFDLGGREIGYLLALGVLLTGVSGVIYVSAVRFVPATSAGILAYLEPVSAAILASLLLDERLTAQILLGGVCIVAGGVLVVARSRSPIASQAAETDARILASART
jgi:drug/metabolite transporter (DMT)-like permease